MTKALFGGVCLALLAWPLAAQDAAEAETGAIRGVVQDGAGAVVPGASVSAQQIGQRQTPTQTFVDERGRFKFEGLAPGRYRLIAAAEGFRTAREEVEVKASETVRVALVLEVGEVTETAEPRRGPPPPLPPPEAPGSGGGFGRGTFRIGPQPQSHESYAHINENRFLNVTNRPLSTVSIDVDTASYANLRRFLRDGELPPPDAVRVEELINYFRYPDPLPEGDAPFAVSSEVAACPWRPEHLLARIALRSKPIETADLPPSNLTFLIDVSGSMSYGDKLPLLKRGLALLVEQMRPEDTVALTVYAGAAGRVLEPTSGRHKDKILAALERLRAGGSTAGAAGLRLAYDTARESFDPEANNRVILATDGDFNVGVASDAEMIRLIESERDAGVFLTVLGFGTGNLKDSKMEAVADHGNGNYAYIDSVLEARRALVEQMGSTLVTVAKDVKLQVELNPAHVKQYRLIGYENRLLADEDFADDKKDAGEMGAGHSVTALYEIVPRGAEGVSPQAPELKYQERQPSANDAAAKELATVKLRYKPPMGEKSRLLEHVIARPEPGQEASDSLELAAALAQFGMLLRDSEHKGEATFDSAADLAKSVELEDEDGRISELVYLIRTAEKLSE